MKRKTAQSNEYTPINCDDRIVLNRWDWVLLIPLILAVSILLVNHHYNDYLVTTRHGINLWNILFRGRFFHFYDDNILASGNLIYNNPQGCLYSIVVYLVFAVWNIPLALLMRFTSIDVMNSTLCLAWAKGLMVALTLVAAACINSILSHMGVRASRRKLAMYLFLTAAPLAGSVYTIGGYDILSIVFQLLGVDALIQKKEKWFLFFFALAFCCKFFAFITFFPLVLLYNKKLGSIAVKTLAVALPYKLLMLPFQMVSAAGGSNPGSAILYMLDFLFTGSYALGFFVFGYVGISVYAFIREASAKRAVWLCMSALGLFFGVLDAYPYWTVFCVPFMIVCMAANEEVLEPLIYLETVFGCALTMNRTVSYEVCYGQTAMKAGLLAKLHPMEYQQTFRKMIMLFALPDSWGILVKIVPACLAAIMLLTFPDWKKKPQCNHNNVYLLAAMHFTACVGLCLIPDLCYIADCLL